MTTMDLDDLLLNGRDVPAATAALLVHRVRTLEMNLAASQRREVELASLVAERSAAVDHLQGHLNELRLQVALGNIGVTLPLSASDDDDGDDGGGGGNSNTDGRREVRRRPRCNRGHSEYCGDDDDGRRGAPPLAAGHHSPHARAHTRAPGSHLTTPVLRASHQPGGLRHLGDDAAAAVAEPGASAEEAALYSAMCGLCVTSDGRAPVGNAGRFGRRGSLGRLHEYSASASAVGRGGGGGAPASARTPASSVPPSPALSPATARGAAAAAGCSSPDTATGGSPPPPPPCGYAGASLSMTTPRRDCFASANAPAMSPSPQGAKPHLHQLGQPHTHGASTAAPPPAGGGALVPAPPAFATTTCPRGDRAGREWKRQRVEDDEADGAYSYP